MWKTVATICLGVDKKYIHIPGGKEAFLPVVVAYFKQCIEFHYRNIMR
jgi:thioredoxin reductase